MSCAFTTPAWAFRRDSSREIFELFTQGHPDNVESRAGMGIGLALARELVELHGGTIQARSDGVGKGSEFIVRLPWVLRRTAAHCTDSARTAPSCALPEGARR